MSNTWVFEILRNFLASIDKIVYWVLEHLVTLFDSLASFQLFNTDIVELFAQRIYFLISIIMIMKISFSIIKYIINPDEFGNQERGMGKVIQNVIISLCLLVSVQWIFEKSYELQDKIVESNIIPKVILGVEMDDNASENNGIGSERQEHLKKIIPFKLLSPFVTFNVNGSTGITYSNGDYYCGGKARFEGGTNTVTDEFMKCVSERALDNTKIQVYHNGVPMDCTNDENLCKTGGLYQNAYANYDYNLLLEIVAHKTTNDVFIMDYKFLISTVVGIFALVMYFNFCLDLGIRIVKFGFFQLVAPIPILSMIDPKSSKGGMFSKWVKQCFNTYIGLFIRIAAVNFVIFIIEILTRPDVLSNLQDANQSSPFAMIVIIFGALMFAKELPQLVSDLTGIDLKGNFNMNPFKRIPGLNVANKLGGAALTGAIGGIGGAVAAGIATGKNGKNVGSIIGSSMMGLGRGMFGGMKAGYGSGLKGAAGATSKTVSGIGNRYTKYGSSTLGGRLGTSIRTGLGLNSEADDIDNEIKILEDYAKFKGQMKAQADFDTHDLLDVANNNIDTGNGQGGLSDILGAEGSSDLEIRRAAQKGVKGLKEYYEDLQNSGTATAQQITRARTALETAQKYVITHADDGVLGNYVDDGNGNISFQSDNNRAVAAIKKQASSYASRYSGSSDVMRKAATATTYKDINEATIAAQTEAITKRDASYNRAVANRDAVRDTRGK